MFRSFAVNRSDRQQVSHPRKWLVGMLFVLMSLTSASPSSAQGYRPAQGYPPQTAAPSYPAPGPAMQANYPPAAYAQPFNHSVEPAAYAQKKKKDKNRPMDPRIAKMPQAEEELEVIHHRSQLVITRSRITRWAVADPSVVDVLQYSLEKGFRESAEREQLLSITGGWPILVERGCELAMTSQTATALARMRVEVESPAGDVRLLGAASLDDEPMRSAFYTLSQVAPTTADSADIDTLVGFVAEACQVDRADLVVEALRVGDLLVIGEGDSLFCEPVLAAASLRVGALVILDGEGATSEP